MNGRAAIKRTAAAVVMAALGLTVAGAVVGTLARAGDDAAVKPAAQRTPPVSSSPPSSLPADTPSSASAPKPSPADVPSWLQGWLHNAKDEAAKKAAAVALTGIQRDLSQHVYPGIEKIPDFPKLVVRQCMLLNSGRPDPDGKTAQAFSTTQHPLGTPDGKRIDDLLRPKCR